MTQGISIEDIAGDGPEVEIERLRIADIEMDPKNPNSVSAAKYEALTREIRDEGFLQPVVVWRRPNGALRMIDGEHRARILAELGQALVPAVVLDEESEDAARLKLLTLNGLRGEFVPIKLAYLLADLAQRIDEKELRKRLGMEPGEFADTLKLASFTDPLEDRLRVAIEKERKEAPTVLRFVLTSRDAQAVEDAISARVEEKMDRGQVLAEICREWVSKCSGS